MKVDTLAPWRSAKPPAPADGYFAGILVCGMSQKLADRPPAFCVNDESQIQSVQAVSEHVTAETALPECVTGGDVYYVTTVGVQRANGKLVAQQVEFAGRKIEQRTDTRIGLLIVVAKMAFIISANLCDSPVRQQLPVIEKAAV